ncbi:MAG: S-layer homology domain-containing protein [Candidatus Atribacteria bacterium]
MKKLTLVLVLVFAFTLTALANPFVDVPLNHWAYDAVQSLAAKGVIVGYPDGTFGGAKSLTRYEFAEAVAKALAYVEGMDFAAADDVVVLEKLAIEFADELASLGVTVADLEAALGANTEAIAALEETVAKHEAFFEPVTITGSFEVSYKKVVLPTMSVATLTDETEINIEAEINDTTTAGVELEFENILSENASLDVDSCDFWLKHYGEDLSLWIGEVEPATIGLGLIYDFDVNEEFYGAWAQWNWEDEEEDQGLGTWTTFMDVDDFYILNVAFLAGEEDDIPFGVTASYDTLALGYAATADVSFNVGDEDEANVALEAGIFYGTALAFAAAGELAGEFEDFDLTVDAYYVQFGFVPTNNTYEEDDLAGVDVEVGFPLTDEEDETQIDAVATWTYEMDTAFVTNKTHEIGGELDFTIDADTEETAMVGATYNVLTGGISLEGEYLNLPLGDEEDTEFVLSAHAEYETLTADYMGVATLVYDFEEDMTLLLEARVDTDGAAMYSAEVKLEYAVADNTDVYVGFEYNDWDDDINDWDEYEIIGTDSTLTAGVEVSF